ncbi:hypothetical protein GIB67_040109 [Kingdonia uniflora]|uniref:Late embryogenesis abundant protein LEA-2 subgroup domain-containing protein n=1 Tax=Kingdonia uniflora TaxID=39325 RepID=A0A7J7MUL2_9MAGN|nr:hypothetical protein GIB67_040109 [Kingdonia uniflora]
MSNHIVDGEEVLLLTYPCADYYVQSPSTVFHVDSPECPNNESVYLSPYPSKNFIITKPNQDVSHQLMFSRYSSSRGSNNSFLQEKKLTYDIQCDDQETDGKENDESREIICRVNEDEDCYDDHEDGEGVKGLWMLFSFSTSSSCLWISFQICWRLLVSIGAALLVFYLATKPPSPKLSIKMAGINRFALGEGVDESGVATKILTCNCSLYLYVDNLSNLYGLHIHPSTIEMSFGALVFATSQGSELYEESGSSTTFTLYMGIKNKAMYGAGRSMQDMLESKKGLPLMIRLKLKSSFRVILGLINSRFHYRAQCFVVLHGAYDEQRNTHVYTSTCNTTSTT